MAGLTEIVIGSIFDKIFTAEQACIVSSKNKRSDVPCRAINMEK